MTSSAPWSVGNRGGTARGGDVGYADTRTGGVSIEYAENNPANEYVTIDSNGVEYDEAGNLIKDEDGFFMAYDGDSQLVAVYADSNGDGDYDAGTDDVVAEYDYDAMNRRIQFINHFDGSGIYGSGPTTVTTRYVHDGQNVIAEYDESSDRQRYYVHGTSYIDERALLNDGLDASSNGVDYYYLLKDLYSVVGLADKKGKELERYTYDAYGKATLVSIPTGDVANSWNGKVDAGDRAAVIGAWTTPGGPCVSGPIYDITGNGVTDAADRSAVIGQWTGNYQNQTIPASGLGNPYFFTGRTRDAFLDAPIGTNGVEELYHYRARYFDPKHGRFVQRDRLGYASSLDLFEFIVSRPTFAVDPSGLDPSEPPPSRETIPASILPRRLILTTPALRPMQDWSSPARDKAEGLCVA